MNCRRCSRVVVRVRRGEPYRPDGLHLDHVAQWAEGGEHTVENLIVCCAECNLSRPRPKRVVRSVRVKAQYINGTYYWQESYAPPRLLDGEPSWSAMNAAAELGLTVVQVLQLAASGALAASGDLGPIRVEIPPEILEVEQRRRREREAANRERRSAIARTGARTRDRKARERSREPLDPERVDYWRGLIEESRARQRRAKGEPQ